MNCVIFSYIMIKYSIYQVDAFADKVFQGNPAAVCPLDEWIDDQIMQQIAMENNLAETAFYVKRNDVFEIRWFTPTIEVDLCGHATLASAYVIFNIENEQTDSIQFFSHRSGSLSVKKNDELLMLNFPADIIEKVTITENLLACFPTAPIEIYKGKTDYLFVYSNEADIINAKPNLAKIIDTNARGIIITSKGENVDFVSRFFGPAAGVNEDPVTGSAHTTLVPYWSQQLNKTEFDAEQLSARKGKLSCKLINDRVEITGKGALYLKGEIYI